MTEAKNFCSPRNSPSEPGPHRGEGRAKCLTINSVQESTWHTQEGRGIHIPSGLPRVLPDLKWTYVIYFSFHMVGLIEGGIVRVERLSSIPPTPTRLLPYLNKSTFIHLPLAFSHRPVIAISCSFLIPVTLIPFSEWP